jgi:rhomboid protease GluP
MHSTESANSHRSFDIRFTPPHVWTAQPGLPSRPNEFRFAGNGRITVEETNVVLDGKRARPFWFGAAQSIALPLKTVVNVECEGRKIMFEYKSAGDIAGAISIWAPSDEEATSIVGALPTIKTERFAAALIEKSDFESRLMQVSPTAFVTPTLVAMNVLVFIWAVWRGAGFMEPDGLTMIDLGSDYGPLTTTGEWWRLVTSTFMHFGVLHLALNMWALWSTGPLVERLYGSWYFAVLYLLAGVVGSVASIVWNPGVNSAGASGAIFGVFGAMLAFIVNKEAGVPVKIAQQHQASTLIFVAYNLFNGFTHSGIDNAAHIGGLVAGFAFGWILARPVTIEARMTKFSSRMAVACVAGVAITVLALGSLSWRSPEFTNEQLFRAAMLRYSVEEEKYLQVLKERPLTGTDLEMAKRIDSELLSYWERMSAAIENVPKLSTDSRFHDFQDAIDDYVEYRRRGFQKYVEGHLKRNAAALRESERYIDVSDRALETAKALNVEW